MKGKLRKLALAGRNTQFKILAVKLQARRESLAVEAAAKTTVEPKVGTPSKGAVEAAAKTPSKGAVEAAVESPATTPSKGAVEAVVESPIPAPAQGSTVEATVRIVVEHLDFKNVLGHVGKTLRVDRGSHLRLVQFDREANVGIAAVEVPNHILESVVCDEAPAPQMSNLTRQPRYLKRQLLFESGVCNPEEEVLTMFELGDEASEDHIDCYVALAVWSFKLRASSRIKVVPAALANEILQDAGLEPRAGIYELSEDSTIQKRKDLIRRWFARFDELAIPVRCGRSSEGPQHWTLLLVKKTGDSTSVEYFDTLNALHPKALRNAEAFVELLGVTVDGALSGCRRNAARQLELECGWMVCHYIEEALRVAAGHPKQSQGWPTALRVRKLCSWLKTIVTTLESERVRWLVEEMSRREALAELELDVMERARQFIAQKELLQRAVDKHCELATLLAHAGSGAEAPPLDVEFLQRFEEFDARRKELAASKRREFEAHRKIIKVKAVGGTCSGG